MEKNERKSSSVNGILFHKYSLYLCNIESTAFSIFRILLFYLYILFYTIGTKKLPRNLVPDSFPSAVFCHRPATQHIRSAAGREQKREIRIFKGKL